MKILSRWLPLLLWALLIFLISSIPEPTAMIASGLSSPSGAAAASRIATIDVLSFIVHFLLFLVLGFLMGRAFSGTQIIALPALLAAFELSFLYAILDEFHQTFVPGRGFDFVDILMDVFGILVGLVLLSLWQEKKFSQVDSG